MRIDSSGNLLVGTTDTDPASSGSETGVALKSGGFVSISRNDTAATVNINTIGSDGPLVDFRKNGTTVGSIGTFGGELYIQSDDVGLYFDASANDILPYGGGFKNGVIDLGSSNNRFKDLYLSSGLRADTLRFSNLAGSERMRIDSSGNVGIGTSSPDSGTPLHVQESDASLPSNTGASALLVERAGNVGLTLGTANTGDATIFFGDTDSLTVGRINYDHSDNSLGFWANSLERMRIDSSGQVGIGTSSPETQLMVEQSGTFNGVHNTAGLKIRNAAATTGIGNPYGAITLSKGTGSSAIAAIGQSASDADVTGLAFYVHPSTTGTAAATEAMRIESSGGIRAGTTSAISTESFTFYTSASIGVAIRNPASGAVRYPMIFVNGSTTVGSITSSASSTSFNTSSDYRLKENVTGITDGIERVKKLNPSRFNFIADADTTVDGFLAHEAQTVVPEAVHGEKDAVDEDGNPDYQGIDQAKLVPLLTAALQEAITKIEDLEARVATLEGN